MTKQGKINLLGIIGLPLAAVVGAYIAGLSGVWRPYTATYIWLFGMNFVFMLIFGLITGIMLRRSSGDTSRWLAIAPTVITAGAGAGTYLLYAVFPQKTAAGAEYLGAPQLLFVLALGLTFLVLLLRVTGIVKRTV